MAAVDRSLEGGRLQIEDPAVVRRRLFWSVGQEAGWYQITSNIQGWGIWDMAADLSEADAELSATGTGPRLPIARTDSRADARKVALQKWQERHRKTLVSGEKRASVSRLRAVLHGKENDVRRVSAGYSR